MAGANTCDAGELAMDIATILENDPFVKRHGWEILGRDIGEIDITLPSGQLARLTIEMVDTQDRDE